VKLRGSLVLLAAAVALSISSLAWACVPVSWFVRVSPSSGPAGSTATVTGAGYASGETVSIYWGGVGGRQLAQAAGPQFSVSVSIPADAASGANYIQAVGSSGRGGATDVFTVAPRTTGGGAPGATPNGVSAPGGAGQPARGGDAKTVSGGEGQRGGGRTALTARGGSEGRAATNAPSTATAGRAGGSEASPVFRGSLGPPVARDEPRSSATTPSPSERTSASDLWSGFASSRDLKSLSGDNGVSSPTSALTFAMALAGVGFLTLLLGLGVTKQRSRQALAERPRSPGDPESGA
jgi:hypothetical protein